ncbi:hypothetical protein [Desulfonema magnum]|uniref:Uncharacterized protein n=1 Tax=Desulfonema magnum TaxID=45655 RepID=A0A975BRF1_9BACT|nr:hypothetical protein [Desulfonema magnum]QTA90469.1 Uncharacterized protein dnm_065300 [Desulfonema magnum]
MKFFKKDHMKLKKAFIRAYHEKENTETGEEWQMNVMRHIRLLGPLSSEINYVKLFDQFVWRFATGACFLALILSAYALQTGFQPEYELAKLFITDPMDFTFTQYFGI